MSAGSGMASAAPTDERPERVVYVDDVLARRDDLIRQLERWDETRHEARAIYEGQLPIVERR